MLDKDFDAISDEYDCIRGGDGKSDCRGNIVFKKVE